MAIVFDVTSNSGAKTGSPFSWNHTVTAVGSNPFLVVTVSMTGQGSSQPTATGVTYNSVAMTKVKSNQLTGNLANSLETSIWFLANPSTGINSVSVTCTQGSNGGAFATATSFTGAQTVSTADATAGNSGTVAGAQSVTVTTVSDGCWVVAVGADSASSPSITGATQTARNSGSTGGSIIGRGANEDTNGSVTAGTAQAIGYTFNGTGFPSWALSAASFAPAPITSLTLSVSDSSTVTDVLTQILEIDTFPVFDSSAVTDVLTTLNTSVVFPVRELANQEIIGVRIIG